MNKFKGCLGQPPNRKKFLLWGWDSYRPHEWVLDKVSFFSLWESSWQCNNCKRVEVDVHRNDQEMMLAHKLTSCPPKYGVATFLEEDLPNFRGN